MNAFLPEQYPNGYSNNEIKIPFQGIDQLSIRDYRNQLYLIFLV